VKKILLDTHILIRRESDRTLAKRLGDVMRYAAELGYELVVHRSSVDEIKNDKNIPESKRSLLLSKMETYPKIDPQFSFYDDEDFLMKVPRPEVQREAEDLHLLYCLYKKEVDLLLTEDSDIAEKAVSLRISGKVKNLRQAAESFKRALNETKPELADVPVFCFYKEGRRWFIGQEGKKAPSFEHLDGFEYIHFLLCHQNQELHPLVLYHRGKTAGDKASDHKVSIEEAESLGLHSEGGVNTYDRTDIRKNRHLIEQAIQRLREKRENISSSDEAMKITEKIDQYEAALNRIEARDYKSPVEKARVNLTKTISKALSKIGKDNPISKHLRLTIKKGDLFKYLPLADEPIWRLYPDSE